MDRNKSALSGYGIKGYLAFLVAVPLIGVAILLITGQVGLNLDREDLHRIAREEYPALVSTVELRNILNARERFLWRALGTQVPADRSAALKDADGRKKTFEDEVQKLKSLPLSAEGRENLAKIEELWPILDAAWSEVSQKLTRGQEAEAKELLLGRAFVASRSIAEVCRNLKDVQNTRTQSGVQASENRSVAESRRDLAIGAGVFLLALFLGYWISSGLARTLTQVAAHLSASGHQVEGTAAMLSSASQALSQGSAESASALEETVASLEELSSMVKLNADNAQQAAGLAQSSLDAAIRGNQGIQELIASMHEVSKHSKQIEEIVAIIEDIAFQTNLSALNAAVEAARAGEQGKSFSVVADAVRALAQRSASAAKDISTLIHENVESVSRGSQIADANGTVLKDIVEQVQKVTTLGKEIASASSEQSNGIGQISKAMNELDSATQTNASAAEEISASAEAMATQAEDLRDAVEELMKLTGALSGQEPTVARVSPAKAPPSQASGRRISAA